MTLVETPSGRVGPAGGSTADFFAHKGVPRESEEAAPRQLREASTFPHPERPQGPRRDFNAAVELVEKASEAIDVLQARCRHLQFEVKEVRDRSKLEVEAAESIAAEWQKLARATKAQLEDCEARLVLAKQAADAAEARAESARERLESLQHLASEQAEHSARYHDKIVSAFGIGSRAHTAFEALEE